MRVIIQSCRLARDGIKVFADDIALVKEQTEHYGLVLPFVDLGGLHATQITVADYNITIATGNQKARYLKLKQDPFADIAPGYKVFNPEYGDPPIEDLPAKYAEQFGTIVCLSVLEHVVNPFEIFKAFYQLLKPSGLLIVSTVWSFPKHSAPRDFWRFSDDCLQMLAEQARLTVLETGMRINIHGGMGIKEIHTGEPQEIRSSYVTARKP